MTTTEQSIDMLLFCPNCAEQQFKIQWLNDQLGEAREVIAGLLCHEGGMVFPKGLIDRAITVMDTKETP